MSCGLTERPYGHAYGLGELEVWSDTAAKSGGPNVHHGVQLHAAGPDLDALRKYIIRKKGPNSEKVVHSAVDIVVNAVKIAAQDGLEGIVINRHTFDPLDINDVLSIIVRVCVLDLVDGINIRGVELLDLSNNGLSGQLDWHLLAQFSRTKYVQLNGNELSNEHIQVDLLPHTLLRLDLRHNADLKGVLPAHYPQIPENLRVIEIGGTQIKDNRAPRRVAEPDALAVAEEGVSSQRLLSQQRLPSQPRALVYTVAGEA